jgi:ABC-type enterochelin transport system permease subunit
VGKDSIPDEGCVRPQVRGRSSFVVSLFEVNDAIVGSIDEFGLIIAMLDEVVEVTFGHDLFLQVEVERSE